MATSLSNGMDTIDSLRALVRSQEKLPGVSVRRADEAVRDLLDLRIALLAEQLGAALVTRDARLASAPGHAATIELL